MIGMSRYIMNMLTDRKIILASASPRRRELMKIYGLPFDSETSDAEDRITGRISADKAAEYYSRLKAEDIFRRHSGEEVTVIGSDTVVVLDGVIFGKPRDEEDAFRMLRTLSGRYHDVHTGVTVISGLSDGQGISEKGACDRVFGEHDNTRIFVKSFTSTTHVGFYDLTDEQIRAYIASGEYEGKAGAYAIQGRGALLAERIDGDYYTVVGFPVAAVARVLGL